MAKDSGLDKRKLEIKWGDDETVAKEILKQGDTLNVDPSWLAGVRQHDAYSCAYFVLTALDRLQQDKRPVGTDLTLDEVQSRIVGTQGMDQLREHTQQGREDQLSVSEFRERLLDLGSPDADVFVTRLDLDFAKEGMTPGQIAVEATKRGYGVGVEIRNQGHLVFALGSSADGKELVCWDPLMGSPDVNHPTTMLRRLPADSPQVLMWGGLKLADKFKFPKIGNVPTQYIYDDQPEGEVKAPIPARYTENRRGFWARVKEFFNSF